VCSDHLRVARGDDLDPYFSRFPYLGSALFDGYYTLSSPIWFSFESLVVFLETAAMRLAHSTLWGGDFLKCSLVARLHIQIVNMPRRWKKH